MLNSIGSPLGFGRVSSHEGISSSIGQQVLKAVALLASAYLSRGVLSCWFNDGPQSACRDVLSTGLALSAATQNPLPLVVSGLSCIPGAHAQTVPPFLKLLVGNGDDKMTSLSQADDGYVVAGSSRSFTDSRKNQLAVMKFDKDFQPQWFHSANVSLSEDIPIRIENTTNGHFWISATLTDNNQDIALIKAGSNGTFSMMGRMDYGIDQAYGLAKAGDGTVILAGRTVDSNAASDIWVSKIGENGTLLWSKAVGGLSLDSGCSVAVHASGHFVIVGETQSGGAGLSDVLAATFNVDGTQQWARTYGGINSDTASAVQSTSDGGMIIVGKTQSYGAGNTDILLMKLTESGAVTWSKVIGSSAAEEPSQVRELRNGGYVIIGKSAVNGNDDIIVIRLTSLGNLVWTTAIGSTSAQDCGYDVLEISDESLLVLGATKKSGNWDGILAKLDTGGLLLNENVANAGLVITHPSLTLNAVGLSVGNLTIFERSDAYSYLNQFGLTSCTTEQRQLSFDPNLAFPSNPSEGSNLGIILGASIGGSIGLLLLSGGIWWFCCRTNEEEHQKTEQIDENNPGNTPKEEGDSVHSINLSNMDGHDPSCVAPTSNTLSKNPVSPAAVSQWLDESNNFEREPVQSIANIDETPVETESVGVDMDRQSFASLLDNFYTVDKDEIAQYLVRCIRIFADLNIPYSLTPNAHLQITLTPTLNTLKKQALISTIQELLRREDCVSENTITIPWNELKDTQVRRFEKFYTKRLEERQHRNTLEMISASFQHELSELDRTIAQMGSRTLSSDEQALIIQLNRQKQAVEVKKAYFSTHASAHAFYKAFQSKLNSVIVGMQSIQSGMIDRAKFQLKEKAAGVLEKVVDGIPIISSAAKLLSFLTTFYAGYQEGERRDVVLSEIVSPVAASEFSETLALQLSEIYQQPLEMMTEEGARVFADGLLNRIWSEFSANPEEVRSLTTQFMDLSTQQEKASTVLGTLKSKLAETFGVNAISTKTGERWALDSVLNLSGIVTRDGRYFGKPGETMEFQYGFCLGNMAMVRKNGLRLIDEHYIYEEEEEKAKAEAFMKKAIERIGCTD